MNIEHDVLRHTYLMCLLKIIETLQVRLGLIFHCPRPHKLQNKNICHWQLTFELPTRYYYRYVKILLFA